MPLVSLGPPIRAPIGGGSACRVRGGRISEGRSKILSGSDETVFEQLGPEIQGIIGANRMQGPVVQPHLGPFHLLETNDVPRNLVGPLGQGLWPLDCRPSQWRTAPDQFVTNQSHV